MTTLQKQLAKIAATSTHQLDLQAQKVTHSKSLLFEPRVAAAQDFTTLYQLCYEGFHELCLLDPLVAAFASNLFSEQSMKEERTRMTKKENEELDLVLQGCMTALGRWLQLKPAIKALEWLVRRFQVHEYNTEFLLLTLLPYHSCPLFLNTLSIIEDQRLPQSLRFLYTYKHPLANPSQSAVVKAATRNTQFFLAFNQYTLNTAKLRHHNDSLLSFWAAVTTQAINGMLDTARSGRETIQRQREEDILLKVFHLLNEALSIKGIPDLNRGCYMIITVLVAKSALEDKVLDSLMEAVVSGLKNEASDDCLLCLSTISAEKKDKAIPGSVWRRLLRLDNIPDRLVRLSQRASVESLAYGFALQILSRSSQSDGGRFDILEKILLSQLLRKSHTSHILKGLLVAVIGHDGALKANLEHWNQLSGLIVRLLESPISGSIHRVIRKEKMDIELLEMKLNTTISSSWQDALPVMRDQEMTELDSEGQSNPIHEIISSFSSHENEDLSFLDGSNSSLFKQLSIGYLQVITADDYLDLFLDLPVLGKCKAFDQRNFLTFLLRMLGSQLPVFARNQALQRINALLQQIAERSIDLQALVPFLLVALGDPSTNIRRSAADCFLTLSRHYESKKSIKKTEKGSIWGSAYLYGSANSEVRWLSQDDLVKLLSIVIRPNLEECGLDSNCIGNILEASLNGNLETRDLKSAVRSALFDFLSSHAVLVPVLRFRLPLLSVLSRIGKVGSSGRLRILLPQVRAWASLSLEVVSSQCRNEAIDLVTVDEAYLNAITPREPEGVHFLQSLISGQYGIGRAELRKVAYDRLESLWSSLKPGAQLPIAKNLLDMALSDDEKSVNSTGSSEAVEALQTLRLNSTVLASFLDDLPSPIRMPDLAPATKRRRTSRAEMARFEIQDPKEIEKSLRRITLILELIESSRPERHPVLLRGLFHLLGELQHYRIQIDSSLAYLQGLVISSLLSIVNHLKDTRDSTVDKSIVRADLLVDCIRHTSNIPVQNEALLLISSLASWEPEIVLHSVMPIFTFMGSPLLRQTDDYSTHVIDQTISRVIPPLAVSLKKKNPDLVSGAANLLLSFTAAYEHIPLHRRLGLFTQLSTTLGPEDSLFAIISMLVDRYPSDQDVRAFNTQLIKAFDTITVLKSSRRYIDLINDALQPKRTTSNIVFGLLEKDEPQIDKSIDNLLDALAELLEDRTLRHRLEKTLRLEDNSSTAVKEAFSQQLEKVISLSIRLKGRGKLQERSNQVLESLLKLLPVKELVESAESLLENPSDDVRQIVLKSVELQVPSVAQNDGRSQAALFAFIPRTFAIIQHSPDATLRHAAVSCVDQISEAFGKRNTRAIAEAGAVISGAQSLGSTDERLRIMSLLCLTSIVEVLRDDFIGLLPQVLPMSFKYLEEQSESDAPNEDIHNAVYALLCSILEQIPFMFTGEYLNHALQISHKSATSGVLSVESKESRQHFYLLAARCLSAKACFIAVDRNWVSALTRGPEALGEHLGLISAAIGHHPKSEVTKNSQVLFNFLLKAFDLRYLWVKEGLHQGFNEEELFQLELLVKEVALSMTMKLNDAAFRPFFARFVEWAAKGLPKKEIEGRKFRAQSLFTFLHTFFGKLKSLVTSYSSYVLDFATEILQSNAPIEKDESRPPLIQTVLDALSQSFQYDQDDFWQSPSHFSAICTPIISLLNHPSSALVTESLIPAITELATAASSPDHHKTMNSVILRFMRDDRAHVRLAAVKCEQSLTERLGDEWLNLLPEMLPFISELQEDDDEEVERETQRWINRIEDILGESLDSMLQ